MSRYLIIFYLIFFEFGFSINSYAFTKSDKIDVLHQILDIQSTHQNKDNKEIHAIIESLINSINNKKNIPKLSLRIYQRTLENQLELQKHDPDNDTIQIIVDALIRQILRVNLKYRKNLRNFINDEETFQKFVKSTKPKIPQCDSSHANLIDGSSLSEILKKIASQVEKNETPSLAFEDSLKIKEDRVKNIFQNRGYHVSSFNDRWIRKNYSTIGNPRLNEPVKKFIQYWNKGDGDCALHGMNKNRINFVKLIKDKFRKDPLLRTDLRDGVYNYCIHNHLNQLECENILDPSMDEKNMYHFEKYIKKRLISSKKYLSFGTTGKDNNIGSLAAAARVFKENVRVWKKSTGSHLEKIFQVKNNSQEKYIDLLYSGMHFDRLIEERDTTERLKFLDKELEFLKSLDSKKKRI